MARRRFIKGFTAATDGVEELTAANGKLFFAGKNSVRGAELWVSDGTVTGTKLVRDIKPSSGSGLQESHRFGLGYTLTAVGSQVFFAADNGTRGFELWKSNGTAIGTNLVKDINPGANGSQPSDLTDVNGTLYFAASDSTGTGLWKSNGTAAGTVKLKNIDPDELTSVNGTLFFSAEELWKSNGTAPGTVLVKNIHQQYASYPRQLTRVGARLFFTADDGTHGRELWVSNGTALGTVLVKDINPGNGSSDPAPQALTAVGNILFFLADDGVHGLELWKSNGTAAGTSLVKEFAPGAASPSFGLRGPTLTEFKGLLYFEVDGELWRSNGTAAGTVRVAPTTMVTEVASLN
jgi:ELWxxDGT repeat protein